MQFKLIGFLDSDLKVVENRKEAKKCLREFDSLLRTADWQYMGGEDVYEELQKMKKNVAARLQRSTAKKQAKKIEKKPKAKKASKVTKKKPAKKVKTKSKPVRKIRTTKKKVTKKKK